MSQAIQMDHSNSQLALALPVKRRRGRPRKDRSLPPVVERVKENTAPQVEKKSDANNNSMVGQAVTGIIEAAFDAGFLLSVRIGDSKTRLRGIVFKPGHYVPITSENDIAPHVQMIQRNETNFPMENQMHSHKRRRRHRAEHNGSPSAHRGASKGNNNNLSIMLAPSVPPVGARGTVVPVVLQPVSLTNGLPRPTKAAAMDASQAYMEALRDKGVQMVEPLAMLPPEGSTTMMVAHEAPSSQRQVSHGEASEDVHNQNSSPGDRGRDAEHREETSRVASSNVVLPGNDSDRNQGYPQTPENLHVRRETEDTNKPPSTNPPESLHSNLLNHSKSLPNKFMHYGTGRMTELLQALQENLVENQVHQSSEIKFQGSKIKDEATNQ